jgi:hypothetical protein
MRTASCYAGIIIVRIMKLWNFLSRIKVERCQDIKFTCIRSTVITTDNAAWMELSSVSASSIAHKSRPDWLLCSANCDWQIRILVVD